MPVVLRIGPYKFNFFSTDGLEPPHIHVEAGNKNAKFWLNPIDMAANHGFAAYELNKIRKIIEQHQLSLLQTWREYFDEDKNKD